MHLLKFSSSMRLPTCACQLFARWRSPLVNSVGETNAWLATLWAKREAIADKPALLVWGTKDKLVPLPFLGRWQGLFAQAETLELNAGHFVQEEAAGEVSGAVERFLGGGALFTGVG